MNHRFWLVCNPDRLGTQPPTHQHATYASAEKEALRLALANPGQVFHVMASAACCVKQEVFWQTFHEEVTEHDPGVPF
jgi:hypothetical protein